MSNAPAPAPNLGQLSNEIIRAVTGPTRTAEIAHKFGLSSSKASNYLTRLVTAGHLTRPYRGIYAPNGATND